VSGRFIRGTHEGLAPSSRSLTTHLVKRLQFIRGHRPGKRQGRGRIDAAGGAPLAVGATAALVTTSVWSVSGWPIGCCHVSAAASGRSCRICRFKITNWVSTTASPAVRQARMDQAANPQEGRIPVARVANPAVG
jgi:hypothetical protein